MSTCISNAPSSSSSSSSAQTNSHENNIEFVFSKLGIPKEVLFSYQKLGLKTLYPWQTDCLYSTNVLRGDNLVYCAPTSGGKTLVAELVLLKTMISLKKLAIFVLPYVSLVLEKEKHFKKMIDAYNRSQSKPNRIKIKAYYGDKSASFRISNGQLIICTIEKANMIFNNLIVRGCIHQLGVIVFDETHVIGNKMNGYLIELLITKIMYLTLSDSKGNLPFSTTSLPASSTSPSIQIIALSATMGNVQELATWIHGKLYITNFRPIPLMEYIQAGNQLYDTQGQLIQTTPPIILNTKDNLTISKEYHPLIALCQEGIKKGQQVIVFAPTKAQCSKLTKILSDTLDSISHQITNPLDMLQLQQQRQQMIDQLQQENHYFDIILQQSLLHGIAYHHAGLTNPERHMIESAFRTGLISILIATTTVAAGVNLPAGRVIIVSLSIGRDPLDIIHYRQMTGRAGRAGQTNYGESYLCIKENERSKAMELIQQTLPNIESQFHPCQDGGNALFRALVEIIGLNLCKQQEHIFQFMKMTLLYHQLHSQTIHSSTTITQPPTLEANYLSSSSSYSSAFLQIVLFSLQCLIQIRILEERKYMTSLPQPTPDLPPMLPLEPHVPQQVLYPKEIIEYDLTRLGKGMMRSGLDPDETIVMYESLIQSFEGISFETSLPILYLLAPYQHNVSPRFDLLEQYYTRAQRQSPKHSICQLYERLGLNISDLVRFQRQPPSYQEIQQCTNLLQISSIHQVLYSYQMTHATSTSSTSTTNHIPTTTTTSSISNNPPMNPANSTTISTTESIINTTTTSSTSSSTHLPTMKQWTTKQKETMKKLLICKKLWSAFVLQSYIHGYSIPSIIQEFHLDYQDTLYFFHQTKYFLRKLQTFCHEMLWYSMEKILLYYKQTYFVQELSKEYRILLQLPSMTRTIAQVLIENHIDTIEALLLETKENLVQMMQLSIGFELQEMKDVTGLSKESDLTYDKDCSAILSRDEQVNQRLHQLIDTILNQAKNLLKIPQVEEDDISLVELIAMETQAKSAFEVKGTSELAGREPIDTVEDEENNMMFSDDENELASVLSDTEESSEGFDSDSLPEDDSDLEDINNLEDQELPSKSLVNDADNDNEHVYQPDEANERFVFGSDENNDNNEETNILHLTITPHKSQRILSQEQSIPDNLKNHKNDLLSEETSCYISDEDLLVLMNQLESNGVLLETLPPNNNTNPLSDEHRNTREMIQCYDYHPLSASIMDSDLIISDMMLTNHNYMNNSTINNNTVNNNNNNTVNNTNHLLQLLSPTRNVQITIRRKSISTTISKNNPLEVFKKTNSPAYNRTQINNNHKNNNESIKRTITPTSTGSKLSDDLLLAAMETWEQNQLLPTDEMIFETSFVREKRSRQDYDNTSDPLDTSFLVPEDSLPKQKKVRLSLSKEPEPHSLPSSLTIQPKKKNSPYLTPFTASKIRSPGKYLNYSLLYTHSNETNTMMNEDPLLMNNPLDSLPTLPHFTCESQTLSSFAIYSLNSFEIVQYFLQEFQQSNILSFECIFRELPSSFLRKDSSVSSVSSSPLFQWSRFFTTIVNHSSHLSSSYHDLSLLNPLLTSIHACNQAKSRGNHRNPMVLRGFMISFGKNESFFYQLPQLLPLRWPITPPLPILPGQPLTLLHLPLSCLLKVSSYLGYQDFLIKSPSLYAQLYTQRTPPSTTKHTIPVTIYSQILSHAKNPLFLVSKACHSIACYGLLLEWRNGNAIEWEWINNHMMKSTKLKITSSINQTLIALRERDLLIPSGSILDPSLAVLYFIQSMSITLEELPGYSALIRQYQTIVDHCTAYNSSITTEITNTKPSSSSSQQEKFLRLAGLRSLYLLITMNHMHKLLRQYELSIVFYQIEIPVINTVIDLQMNGLEVNNLQLIKLKNQLLTRSQGIVHTVVQYLPQFTKEEMLSEKKIMMYLRQWYRSKLELTSLAILAKQSEAYIKMFSGLNTQENHLINNKMNNITKQRSDWSAEKVSLTNSNIEEIYSQEILTYEQSISLWLPSHPLYVLLQEYRTLQHLLPLICSILANRKFTRVHAIWMSLGTETGRMIAMTPPLQHIPHEIVYLTQDVMSLHEEILYWFHQTYARGAISHHQQNMSSWAQFIQTFNHNLLHKPQEFVRISSHLLQESSHNYNNNPSDTIDSPKILARLLSISMIPKVFTMSSTEPQFLAQLEISPNENNNNSNINNNNEDGSTFLQPSSTPTILSLPTHLMTRLQARIRSHPQEQGIIHELMNKRKLPLPELLQWNEKYRQEVSTQRIIEPVRTCFRAKPGFVLLSADYSQIELRILAHLSQDTQLTQAFVLTAHNLRLQTIHNTSQSTQTTQPTQSIPSMQGTTDVFRYLASIWKQISPEELTSEDRNQVKQFCYALIYGASAASIARDSHGQLTEQEVQRLWSTFDQTFPQIKQFIQAVQEDCQAKGYVESILGRKRYIPNLQLGAKPKQTTENMTMKPELESEEIEMNSYLAKLKAKGERQAINSVCQASAADLIKMAMINIQCQLEELSKRSNDIYHFRSHRSHPGGGLYRRDDDTRLVMQIHDELVYEVREKDLIKVAKIVKSCMESAISLRVPLEVKLRSGVSWGELTPLTLSLHQSSQISQSSQINSQGNNLSQGINQINPPKIVKNLFGSEG